MSVTMEDNIKRWTAKRKMALVVEIIRGKNTVAEASRSFVLSAAEIEGWVEDANRGVENSLWTKAPQQPNGIEALDGRCLPVHQRSNEMMWWG
jgi:transposase-like protein